MGNRLAYGDVRLEAATFAVGQLDATLSCHPPLSGWMFWGQSETTRRHAETDGRRINLHWFVAFPHCLPLRVGANLSLAERGSDIAAFAYAVELNSWMVQPDPGQLDPPDSGFAHLRQAGPPGRGRKVFFQLRAEPIIRFPISSL